MLCLHSQRLKHFRATKDSWVSQSTHFFVHFSSNYSFQFRPSLQSSPYPFQTAYWCRGAHLVPEKILDLTFTGFFINKYVELIASNVFALNDEFSHRVYQENNYVQVVSFISLAISIIDLHHHFRCECMHLQIIILNGIYPDVIMTDSYLHKQANQDNSKQGKLDQ